MSKIIDTVERVLFGATAQERVDMIIELASQRMEARMEARIVAALEADDDTDETAQQDGGAGLKREA